MHDESGASVMRYKIVTPQFDHARHCFTYSDANCSGPEAAKCSV